MSDVRYPRSWTKVCLGQIGQVKSGVGFPKKFQGKASGDVPVYKVGDVSKAVTERKGKLSVANHYVTSSEATELKGVLFRSGSTLFAKIGEAVKLNRRALVVRPGLADNNVMAFVPFLEEMDSCIHYFLRTIDLSEISRSTTVPSIRKGDIENLSIHLPSLAEQKVIADKLDTLLAQVEATKARLERIPKLLKRFRQSVLAAAMNGQLTEEWRQGESSDRDPRIDSIDEHWKSLYKSLGKKRPVLKVTEHLGTSEIPRGWLKDFMGRIFDVFVGATPSRKEAQYWGGEIPWVSSSEVAFCRINSTKESITKVGLANASTSVHPAGTIMLAMIGQGKTRGQVAILDIPACHNQNTAALRVPEGYVIPEFGYYYLVQQYDETRQIGGGNNQKALSKAVIQAMPFPVPPYAEQAEIVRLIEQHFTYADQVDRKVNAALNRVNKLTQSILAKAFRGELTEQWRKDNPDLISGENSAEALLERINAEREQLSAQKPKRQKRSKQ